MTAFFCGHAVDSVATSLLVTQPGWKEAWIAAPKINQGELAEVIMVKTAVAAVLVGAYALANQLESELEYPLEKTLQIGNLIVWGVQAWNAANVLATLAQG